jgi:hypothetical protein
MEEIQMYLDEAKDLMDKAIKHTGLEFNKIRAGKASPAMLDGLYVDFNFKCLIHHSNVFSRVHLHLFLHLIFVI